MRTIKKESKPIIDNTEEVITDETIKLVKKHLKESKNQIKSVIISNNHHEKIKLFCKSRGLKISPFLENIIDEYISNYNSKKSQPV